VRIFDHAAGKWPRIISALVGEQFTNTRKHQPCPRGQGTDRFRFSDHDGTGTFFCACSEGRSDGFDLLRCVRSCSFAEAANLVESVIGPTPDRDTTPKPRAARMETVTVNESKYLASRGLEIAPGLRWSRSVDYFDEQGKKVGAYPAMLGEIYRGDGDDLKFLGYHVTYLHNGAKAPVPTPRKILEGGVSGGSVRLYPAAEVMGVGEGIETCIASKMMTDIPTWAALNTALLQAWEPPAIAKKVFIFGDKDSNFAGQAAAYALAKRLRGKGLEVVVELPAEADIDWNDVWLMMQKKAA
jgi:putative DNA primase/helicase